MPRLLKKIVIVLALLLTCGNAFALNPDEVLSDPALENRARGLSAQLRCLVCQNQSIDDSDAQLARDLRLLVREKLVEGLTDEQILDYLVARYGEFVLLNPRFESRTFLLWVGPIILLFASGLLIFFQYRKSSRNKHAAAELSKEEKSKIDSLLSK